MFNRNLDPGEWTIEVYERPDGSCPYDTFLKSLDPYRQIVLSIAVEEVLGRQGHNVCGSSWGKPLGRGLYEFRVNKSLEALCNEIGIPVPEDYAANPEILLRAFFAVEGARIVLLLSGYDKRKDSSQKRQDREIKDARKLLKEHKA